MTSSVQVAIVQMCSGADTRKNLEQVEFLLDRDLEGPANLIVLPECFARFGGDMTGLGRNTEPVRQWMADLACRYNAWLIGGSIPFDLESGENPRASCFVYDPQGQELARYDKIHLFDVEVADNTGNYRESDDYSAGSQTVVVDMGFARTGLSICYDLRFPELYRQLVEQGVSILTVPSAFTRATGEAHWEVLLRARAIENQCYVLAPNQGGEHPNRRETWGHSMIISPRGDVLAEAGDEPCVLSAELNLDLITETRSRMPCLEHRKL
ncbi:MAG: carbon-nitrogen hydrolase family protein [Endozoicomonas sp.]